MAPSKFTAITTRKQKSNGYQYKWIKLGKGDWAQLHYYNWIKKHGPIPEGFILSFIDGDTLNCEPENLKLITRQQNMNNIRYTDSVIATYLSRSPGGSGKYDPELREELLNHPELLNAKRAQLALNRELNKHESQD